MTLEEENALRYVAGFVIKSVKDKLKVPDDQETLDILNSMVQEASSCTTPTSSKHWVKFINWGGLVQITEDAHQLFCAIEYCVRSQLHISNMCSMDVTFRSRLTNSVLANSELQFQWACIGNGDDEVSETCLETILHKWITIRAFCLQAQSWSNTNKKTRRVQQNLRAFAQNCLNK